MVHLQRTMEWEHIEPSTRGVEATGVSTPAELLYLPGGDVPSAIAMVPNRQLEQLLLPICIHHDGLSLRATIELDAHVAFLYGASDTPLQLWLFAGSAARRL
jgi:hypothetical protein